MTVRGDGAAERDEGSEVYIPAALDASSPPSPSLDSLLSDAQHPTDMASHGLLFSFAIISFLYTRLAGSSRNTLSPVKSRCGKPVKASNRKSSK
jgi:hypothetical protein